MKKILSWIKKNFITGLITVLPFVLTIYIIYLLFIKIDRFLGNYIKIDIPGLGVIILIFIIFILGLFVRNIIGSKILKYSELLIDKMPFINRVYKSIKHITSSIIGRGKGIFKEAVLIEYPRRGVYSIGFITENMNNSFDKIDNKIDTDNFVALFVPTTPNPTSGYLIYAPKDDIIKLDIDVETAMKIVVSGAIVKRENFMYNTKKGRDKE